MVWTQQKQKLLRRGVNNTQKNYTEKDLNDLDKHDGVITHLEPDIWSVKLSGPEEASLQTKLVELM